VISLIDIDHIITSRIHYY